MSPDEGAVAWIEANADQLHGKVRGLGGGDDEIQEAMIEVMTIFRSGRLDAIEEGLPRENYLWGSIIRLTKGLLAGQVGRGYTGSTRRNGHVEVMGNRTKRFVHLEGMIDSKGDLLPGADPAAVECGYDELEGELLAEAIEADIAGGMSPKEAALKHGLRPQEKLPPGITWRPRRQYADGTWIPGRYDVRVQSNGKRVFGGDFKSLKKAKEKLAELRELYPPSKRGRKAKEAA